MPIIEKTVAGSVVSKHGSKIQSALLVAALALGFGCATSQSESSKVDVSSVENLRPAMPVIPDRTFNLTNYGGIGDGKTMNTEAFKAAVEAVKKAGGGKLIVPQGVFLTGPFTLCSSMNLHLEDGAVIQAPDTFEALGYPNPTNFTSQKALNAAYRFPRSLISGNDLHDVALTGNGTIDGSGKHWWEWSDRAEHLQRGRLIMRRPHLVRFNYIDRLYVADVTLQNSPMFHLVPGNVNDLTIERVKVRAPFDAPNTDAIDPGPGNNFWIHDCDIDTGDDDIVIKSGGNNILIENNTIKHGHGISIGSPTEDGISNMLVRHCTFTDSVNAIRIKSRRGAGGVTKNIRYTDIQMTNVEWAILLFLDYNAGGNFHGDPSFVPSMHDILIDHVTIENSRNAGYIHGLPDSRITGVVLRDVTINAGKDLEIRNADDPIYERVTKNIVPGMGPPEIKEEH